MWKVFPIKGYGTDTIPLGDVNLVSPLSTGDGLFSKTVPPNLLNREISSPREKHMVGQKDKGSGIKSPFPWPFHSPDPSFLIIQTMNNNFFKFQETVSGWFSLEAFTFIWNHAWWNVQYNAPILSMSVFEDIFVVLFFTTAHVTISHFCYW